MNAVVGLGWGDEGKGLVTDYLCGEAVASGKHPVVIRTNGGHQAGHTVVRNGRRHVFSSFGSGTLLGGSTYWTAACTFNPTAFMNERKLLEDIDPFFAIHPHSPVTTPYDIKANRDMETRLGHGSVGVGFGTTLQREEDHRHLFVQDLYHPRVLKEKLNMIAGYYGYKPDEEAVRRFLKDAEACCDHMVLVDDWTRVCSLRNPEYIFEGAQGIMLDQKFGIFPNVTRSYTTSHQARAMGASDIYYVTRSYATRHGNGWFPGEMPLPLTNNSEETNKKHDWQGEFRTAPLDPDLLTYALDCDRAKCRKHLVITCMDQFPIDIPNLLEAVQFEFTTILASYGPQANNIKRIR